MATGWMEGRECAVSPRSKSRTSRRWCHPAKAFTITPIAISTVPNRGDSPYDSLATDCVIVLGDPELLQQEPEARHHKTESHQGRCGSTQA